MNWELPYLPHPVDDMIVWVVFASILLPALAVVWKRGIIPFWKGSRALFRIVERVDEVNEHLAKLVTVVPVLVEIGEQFKPNGGSSLWDQIERIRQMHDDHIQQFERHLTAEHGG